LTHNPEFSICEFYMAYADMYDLMDLTESMISGLVYHLTGGYKLKYHPEGKEGPEMELNFEAPWKRFNMIEELEKQLDVKFPSGDKLDSDETNKFLRDLCTKVSFSLNLTCLTHTEQTTDPVPYLIVAQRRLQ